MRWQLVAPERSDSSYDCGSYLKRTNMKDQAMKQTSNTFIPLIAKPLLRNFLLVVGGSLAIGLGAQITVPMVPVPMTLQTLIISVIGLTFGARLAGLTLLVYLLEGAMGLPVFANGGFGSAKLVGPTAGYLWGFVGMAFLTGFMVENGFKQGVPRLFTAAFVPATLLFVPGVLVLWAVTPLDFLGAFKAGALPFLIGDIVKSLLAALIVAGAWSGLQSIRKRD
jgi:biotin transport system substrate-specific component